MIMMFMQDANWKTIIAYHHYSFFIFHHLIHLQRRAEGLWQKAEKNWGTCTLCQVPSLSKLEACGLNPWMLNDSELSSFIIMCFEAARDNSKWLRLDSAKAESIYLWRVLMIFKGGSWLSLRLHNPRSLPQVKRCWQNFQWCLWRVNILRKAILFLLTPLGCLEETLDLASIDLFKRYCW